MTKVIHLDATLRTFPSCQAVFHQHQPMVALHLSSFTMPIVAQVIVTLLCHRALVTRLLSQGYKVNRLSNTFMKFYGDTLIKLDNTRKMFVRCLLILSGEMIFIFDGFADGQINNISQPCRLCHA